MCCRTGNYTVCWRVRASFSPEILQAGTVKGLTRLSGAGDLALCHRWSTLPKTTKTRPWTVPFWASLWRHVHGRRASVAEVYVASRGNRALPFIGTKEWTNMAQLCRVRELCESRGGRPGLSVLTRLTVSVDVKQHWPMIRHWSQFVPNMSTDIRGHEALHHHQKRLKFEGKSICVCITMVRTTTQNQAKAIGNVCTCSTFTSINCVRGLGVSGSMNRARGLWVSGSTTCMHEERRRQQWRGLRTRFLVLLSRLSVKI